MSQGIKYDQVETKPNNLEIESPETQIDIMSDRYPYCIVWTMIPLLSWLFPSIGHTGIGSSDGQIHDFGGPYYVAVDNFSFGRPMKYIKLDNSDFNQKQYDSAVIQADEIFRQRTHNLFTNNCHSHVAEVLNILRYKGKNNYNMVDIWFMSITKSHYVSFGHILCAWLPVLIIFGIIIPFVI
ncbi:hypothetical protein pb186bvf_011856 [Paramecium bursaria]